MTGIVGQEEEANAPLNRATDVLWTKLNIFIEDTDKGHSLL